jgi:hypothetical protein
MQSGTILSFAQSPPPMQFPARALATLTGPSSKKVLRQEAIAISAQPLLEL